MSVKKFTDWSGYWLGLRQNIIKCIGTTGTAWLGTNTAAAMGVPIPGIDWKQALAMFGVHIGIEVFTYMKNVQPAVITETIETAFTSKDPTTGTSVTQASKTTTVTPAEQPKTP